LGCSRRPWAVRVVLGPLTSPLGSSVFFGPFASSMSPLCRPLAVRVIVGPYASSLSPAHFRLTRRDALRPLVVSFGPLCLRLRHRDVLRPFVWLCLFCSRSRWAHRAVVGPFTSLLGPSRRRWAIRVVVGHSRRGLGRPVILRLLALSLGLPCSRVAPRVFVSPAVWSFPCSCCGVARLVVVQPFPAVRIVVTLVGPPTSWVPPLVAPSPSHIAPFHGPTSLSRGEGHRGACAPWWGARRGSEVVVVVVEGKGE